MPFSITTKDGIKISNIPDGMPANDPSLVQRVQDIRQSRINAAQVPSVNEDIGSLEAGLIAAGRGITSIGRAVGLADPEDESVTRQFRELQEQAPIATTVGEIAGQTAPFLLPGTAVGAIASLPARALASGVLGATEGGLIARGEGGDTSQQAGAAGIGGIIAGGLELALPRISRIGRQIFRKLTGSVPEKPLIDAAGNPSEEFIAVLQKEGKSFDDVVQQVNEELSEEFTDPNQLARKAFLESQGIDPTKAQISRTADDFQLQQEAAKTSTAVRDAIEKQDAHLTTRFNQAVLDTGGQSVTPTSTVTDALVTKATSLDEAISGLYKQAREAAPGEKNVRFDTLIKDLRRLAPTNRRTGGNIEAIVGDLQSKGIIDGDMNIVGKVDVETAEDVRKLMNELYDAQNGFGNGVLRELKGSLDDDVFRAAGDDVFREARKAKTDFEQGLTRAKISKFDSRKSNLVRDVLENKIAPDELSNKVVFGKAWRDTDLQQLKDYITDTPEGVKAFDDLRADVLDTIKNKSFIGPEDANGNKALSRDKLEKALNSIGDKKLAVLFSSDERKFLRDMLQVSKLREPVRGTAQGRGPSAQAISRLEEKLKNIPILGSVIEFIDFDSTGKAVLKASPERKIIDVTPSASGLIPAAAAAGGVAILPEGEQ